MDAFVSLKDSIKCGYDAVWLGQENSSKGAAVHSSTPSKNCEQNNVAALNDNVNVKHVAREEEKYPEFLGKSPKQNTVKS